MYFLRKINLALNFFHPGLRYRVLKIASSLFGWSQKQFEVEFFGRKYSGTLSNHIDFLTFFFGSYERGILNFLRAKILKPDMTVLDVGANIGHHSIFFSSFTKRVISFEPYPKVRTSLETKIESNKISNIEVIPYGLSNQNQKLEYFEPPKSNSGVGSFQSGHYMENSKSGLILELVEGDQFLLSSSITNFDLIKIDVEGFEHFVLEGLGKSLKKSRPFIVMEFNKETQDYCKSFESFRTLFPENYIFYRFDKQFTQLAKIMKFDFDSDIQTNIFCIPTEKANFQFK